MPAPSMRLSAPHAVTASILLGAALAVIPLSAPLFDVALIAAIAIALLAGVRDDRNLRRATLVVRVGLVVAAARMVAVATTAPAESSLGYGVIGGIGELVAGGNALFGTAACAVALAVLVVAAWRRDASADALLACAALGLCMGAALVVARQDGGALATALRAMPLACGVAVALSVPAVVACARRRSTVAAP